MEDQGHENLLADLRYLLSEAEAFQFHDFQNTNYPAPKVALVNRLTLLAEQAKDGRYDN